MGLLQTYGYHDNKLSKLRKIRRMIIRCTRLRNEMKKKKKTDIKLKNSVRNIKRYFRGTRSWEMVLRLYQMINEIRVVRIMRKNETCMFIQVRKKRNLISCLAKKKKNLVKIYKEQYKQNRSNGHCHSIVFMRKLWN